MTTGSQREEGFALVAALWAALILGLVSSYIVVANRTEARISRTALVRARQRAAAEAILGLEELRLLGPGAATLALDGTPFTTTYAGYTAKVVLQDQAGLIDLNSAPRDTIKRLFTAIGQLDLQAADAMTDRVLDWRERGAGRRLNGAKAEDYAAANYPYGPREGPFESVAELKLVIGMTSKLYERVSPALTVYSQKPVINTDVAPSVVLAVLPGFDAEAITESLAERDRRHSHGLPTPGFLGGVVGEAVEILVEVADSSRTHTSLRAALRITGNVAEPVSIYREY